MQLLPSCCDGRLRIGTKPVFTSAFRACRLLTPSTAPAAVIRLQALEKRAKHQPQGVATETSPTARPVASSSHQVPQDAAAYVGMFTSAVLDRDSFVQLTLKGRITPQLPWREVTVRHVLIKGALHIQVSHFDARQNTVKNFRLESDAEAKLNELLSLPFQSWQLRTTTESLSLQVSKKGKAILHRTMPEQRAVIQLEHNRTKQLPLSAAPNAFLQKIGLQTSDGRIRADMQDKFTQINDFLRLLDHTDLLDQLPVDRAIQILDCGCGSSHLTLSTHHYLNTVRGRRAVLTGVDVNAMLMQRGNTLCAELGIAEAARFVTTPIAGFTPQEPPDLVLALHACDTATDDALALAVRCGATGIMAVPCCHKHLNRQLLSAPGQAALLRHGILLQRTADMLTDALRASILQVLGYRTSVVEFVSAEHTPRNLLIRAVKAPMSSAAAAAKAAAAALVQYDELKAFWGVEPHLESLLAKQLAAVRQSVGGGGDNGGGQECTSSRPGAGQNVT